MSLSDASPAFKRLVGILRRRFKTWFRSSVDYTYTPPTLYGPAVISCPMNDTEGLLHEIGHLVTARAEARYRPDYGIYTTEPDPDIAETLACHMERVVQRDARVPAYTPSGEGLGDLSRDRVLRTLAKSRLEDFPGLRRELAAALRLPGGTDAMFNRPRWEKEEINRTWREYRRRRADGRRSRGAVAVH